MDWNRISIQYIRMSGTVVSAVLARLTIDAFGIVLAGLNAGKENFWFAHCPETSCVLMGIAELFLAMVCASAFVWSWHEHLVDSQLSRYISLGVIIGAAEWMPISLLVSKTNMVMGYVIDGISFTPSGFVEAALFALTLNTAAAAFTHYNLQERQEHTLNPRGFWKFTLLLILYALSWGVGWAYWDATLRLLEALKTSPFAWSYVSRGVIVSVMLIATFSYLRFGPEPVVPQRGPEASASFSRSWTSFMVYSSVVLLVMCLSDPEYGLLHQTCQYLYPAYVFPHHTMAGFLLFFTISLAWMSMSVAISCQLTRLYGVDMSSSVRLSRQKLASAKTEYFLTPQDDPPHDLTTITVGCCLIYDVMALTTAFAWGQLATGGLSLFRPLIEWGAVAYLIIVVTYSFSLILLIAWAVFNYCPTDEEFERRISPDGLHGYTELSPRGDLLRSPNERFRKDFTPMNDRAA